MKRHVLILSGLLALGVSAQAQTLLNSWENSLEGWTILEPGTWTTTGFSTTTGVTADTYSWQLTASKSPDYGAALQGPSSTNLTAVLAKTLSISLDLDVPAGGSFGYYEQWDLVISQPGGIGNVSVDGYSYPEDANIGGATTLTWTIPASITTAIAANSSLPCSLIFQIGGGFNSGGTNTMFLDNLRANFYGPAQLWVRETWDGDLGETYPTVTPLTNDISSVGFGPASPWVTNPRESGLIISNSPTPTNTLLMAVRGQNEFGFAEPDTMGLPSTLNGATSGFVQDNSFDGRGGITLWSDGDFMTRPLSPNNYINFNIAGEYWFAMTIGMLNDAQYSGDIPASGAGGIGFSDGSDTNAAFIAIGVTGTNVFLGPSNVSNPFGTIPASKSVYISQGTLGQPGNTNSLIYNPYNDPAYGPGAKDVFGNPICTQDGGPSLTNFTGGPYYVSAYGTNKQGTVYGDGILVLGHLVTHGDGTATLDAKTYIAANGDQLDIPTNGVAPTDIQWDCSYNFSFNGTMTSFLAFENGEFPFYMYAFRASSNLANVVGIDPGYIQVSPLANTYTGYPINMTNFAAEANLNSSPLLYNNGAYGTLAYQWYQNGVAIPGATLQYLDITSAATNDSAMPAGTDAGTYTSVATDPTGIWGSVTSQPVAITVTYLPPPQITGVQLYADESTIDITFDEPNLTGADVLTNYHFSGGITPTNATVITGANSTLVQLQTVGEPLGTRITLNVSNIVNVVGGVITNGVETFWTDIAVQGAVSWDCWIDGNSDDTHDYFNTFLPGNPQPTILSNMTLTGWEGPSGGVEVNGGSYFADRMYGWFIAPVTTNYVFYIACDDGGRLSLSTNSEPSNLCVIAVESLWSDADSWTNYSYEYPTGDHRGDGTSTTANAAGTMAWDTSQASTNPATACQQNRSDQFIVAYYDSYNTANGTTLGPPGANDSWAGALSQTTDCLTPGMTNFWPKVDANGQALISLVAGQKYFMQLEHVNQTGGYDEGVTYKFAGAPDPTSQVTTAGLTGANIEALVPFVPSVSVGSVAGQPVFTYTGVLLAGPTITSITNEVAISAGGTSQYSPPPGSPAMFYKTRE
jgi:hypothetical protein